MILIHVENLFSSKNKYLKVFVKVFGTIFDFDFNSQAPDVPELAQTVKPWSDIFKIFTDVFACA